MKELIKMTDYITIIDNNAGNGGHYDKIVRYCNFLKQELRMNMFVPCDDEGNILKEPKTALMYKTQRGECTADEMRLNREYLEAKDKVLFENVEYIQDMYKSTERHFITLNGRQVFRKLKYHTGEIEEWQNTSGYKTIEDMIGRGYKLTNDFDKLPVYS